MRALIVFLLLAVTVTACGGQAAQAPAPAAPTTAMRGRRARGADAGGVRGAKR